MELGHLMQQEFEIKLLISHDERQFGRKNNEDRYMTKKP